MKRIAWTRRAVVTVHAFAVVAFAVQAGAAPHALNEMPAYKDVYQLVLNEVFTISTLENVFATRFILAMIAHKWYAPSIADRTASVLRACVVAMKDGQALCVIKDLATHAVMTMDSVRMELVSVLKVGMEGTVLSRAVQMDAPVMVSVYLKTVFTDAPAPMVGPAQIVPSLSNSHATITKIMMKMAWRTARTQNAAAGLNALNTSCA